MQNKLFHINDYVLILDNYRPASPKKQRSATIVSGIGLVFYGSGEVQVEVGEGRNKVKEFKKSGRISVFYCDENLPVTQYISPKKAVQKVTLFFPKNKWKSIIEDDRILRNYFKPVLHRKESYIKLDRSFHITPSVQLVIDRFFSHSYNGTLEKLYLESKIVELIFAYLKSVERGSEKIAPPDRDKLYHARELLLDKLDSPPSLNHLARLTGLNTFKLKNGFKQLFGLPVYKYLQQKRMEKAFELLENKDFTVQEAAWYVGYESIGSFSNAFYKIFGYRPSEIAKKSLSNKK